MSYNNQYSPRNFSFLPPVCKNLLIINVIVFVATYVLRLKGIDLASIFGLHFYKADTFHFWQYITYAFVHGNLNHLFFNMFAIWMFGYTLENIWGAKKFIFFITTACLGAALTQEITYYFMYSDLASGVYTHVSTGIDNIPVREYLNQINTVGASGIVFGLLLAFGMMFPNDYIYLYFLLPIKTKWFVIGYIALELFNGVVGTSDGIAHFAHLGGALAGFILIMLWRKGKLRF